MDECEVRNAECGVEGPASSAGTVSGSELSTATPHSALHTPHLA